MNVNIYFYAISFVPIIFGKRIGLIQESEKPEGNLVVFAYLGVVASVDSVRGITDLATGIGIADAEL